MMFILQQKNIKGRKYNPCFFFPPYFSRGGGFKNPRFVLKFLPWLVFKRFNCSFKGQENKERNFNKKNQLCKSEAWNYYVSGFVDGEGCFTVSFRLVSKLKTGIQVRPSFSLAQKKSPQNYRLLKRIRDTFGVGAIRDDKKGCYKYETRSLSDIQKNIVPFFKLYPLYTEKEKNFLLFYEICSRMEKREHLTLNGLKEILTLSETLNPSGTKRFSRIKWNVS